MEKFANSCHEMKKGYAMKSEKVKFIDYRKRVKDEQRDVWVTTNEQDLPTLVSANWQFLFFQR